MTHEAAVFLRRTEAPEPTRSLLAAMYLIKHIEWLDISYHTNGIHRASIVSSLSMWQSNHRLVCVYCSSLAFLATNLHERPPSYCESSPKGIAISGNRHKTR